MSNSAAPVETYSYLGPAGTFTEAALAQVPQAVGQTWHPVNNVGQALDDVVAGRSVAAMIAIENTVEGGVSASQDALATIPNLRIIGEYLVTVNFVLVAKPGTTLKDVRVVNAHPVAYAQTHLWLDSNLPQHEHIPASSNVAAAAFIAQMTKRRAELESEKVTFAPRPVPGAIEREIETIDAELARQNELIASKKKESATVAARYEADRQRFIELRNGQPSGAVVTSSDGRYSATQPAGIKLTSAR